MTSVAVVVPWYRAPTPDEEISLRHLERWLGDYDRFALAGRSAPPPPQGLEPELVDDRWLRDPVTYSGLLLTTAFYERFAAYEHVLIHQLDALVFSDALPDWCARGHDYVGAPWLPGPDVLWLDAPAVGNGGLSLRRVEAFLEVLSTRVSRLRTAERWAARWLRGRTSSSFERHEDLFWSFEAPRIAPCFRIAPVEEALAFAWEVEPRRCLELNGGRLPFGCHAWARYDRDFWAPHLLT